MRIVHIQGEDTIKAPRESKRERIEAFKREFIIKHNTKFNIKKNGTY